jgi:predicted methyltransferase
MGFPSVLTQAQRLAADALRAGEAAVDATVGNGVDTLFLARTVGPRGKVFAFDIQQEALDSARRRFASEQADDSAVVWLLRSHAELREAIPAALHGRIGAVMFNLGYLPGGDPTVITRPDSTVAALQAAAELLKPRGVLTVVVYPGHPGGEEEADAVVRWAHSLPFASFQTMRCEFLNSERRPPFLIAVSKRHAR